jgi:hypothetical protein
MQLIKNIFSTSCAFFFNLCCSLPQLISTFQLSLWAKLKNETTARFGAASNMSQSVEQRPVANSIWATKVFLSFYELKTL